MNTDHFAIFFDELRSLIEIIDPNAMITVSRNAIEAKTSIHIMLCKVYYDEVYTINDRFITETMRPAYEVAHKVLSDVIYTVHLKYIGGLANDSETTQEA